MLLILGNFGPGVHAPLLCLVVQLFGPELNINGVYFFLHDVAFLFSLDVLHLAFQVVLYLLLLSVFVYLALVCFFFVFLHVTVYHLAPEAILFLLEKERKESDDLRERERSVTYILIVAKIA